MDFTKLKNFLDHMAKAFTPGCAVVVCRDGKPVYKYAAGYADLESRMPLNGDEFFNIYSCSKITTVTAAAQLLERGEFLLNDPLYDYVPEFRHMAIKNADGELVEAKNPITIGDLFSMTAGFNYNLNAPSIIEMRNKKGDEFSAVDLMYALAKEPISFEPGTHWQYSLGHDVLGGFISLITGKKFRDYVKENIFDPLEMTQSFYHHTPEIEAKMASQYRFVVNNPTEQKQSIVEAQMHGTRGEGHFEKIGLEVVSSVSVASSEYDSGGGGIVTTVSDYAKLMAALSCSGFASNGERILSPKTVELMKTNRMNETQIKDMTWLQLRGYGYGLGVRTHIDKAKSGSIANLGEFGWGGAAGATAIMDTEEKFGVFFVQHTLAPREEWYQPRLINVAYSCLD